jgi:hypothetical protein
LGNQRKLTKANINLTGFNNDAGWTSNTGTVTSVAVSAGTGLSGGGTVTTSGIISLALDFSELTDMTGDIAGTTEFILQNGTVESRKAANEIKLSAFNNDAGWTTNTGTVTSIAAGSYLTGGTITTTGTLAVDATSANTASKVVARDASGNFSAGTITAALNGNASTATTLATARTISLSGDATGSASFDGSANATITVAVANDSHTHDGRYYTEAEADSRFVNVTGDTMTGSLTIGTIVGSAGTLNVTGNITATGEVTAYSDRRFKHNIATIDNALDKVVALRGVNYEKDDRYSMGVIAQEVEAVIPEVVYTDAEGMKSVAYGNIVGVLIEAIKEQQQQIADLKKQLDELQK